MAKVILLSCYYVIKCKIFRKDSFLRKLQVRSTAPEKGLKKASFFRDFTLVFLRNWLLFINF